MSPLTATSDALELDALQELGDEIATLAAHVHAATHRLLALIVEFDRRRGWEVDGHRSCAHWLAFRTGLDLGAAREKVRAARALESLPLVSAAMARGELSFAKVRSITRVASPESEAELLLFAQANTAAQLERVVRSSRGGRRLDEAERERLRHRSRCLSVFPDDDGMYVIRGRLDPEVGALLMRAIEAGNDALFRPETASEIEPAQRRADAIGLVAERALAAGLGRSTRVPACDAAMDDIGDGAADGEIVAGGTKGDGLLVSGTRAERYQVVLHVEPATLEWGRVGGRSDLEDGTHVSAETSRRLSCDASVVRVTRGRDGSVLDVGRRTRTIPPALRRALEVRDRGCCFPGCGLRFTDGHHVVHWADGGPTSLSNTVLLCRFHHRLVHEDGHRVELPPGGRPNFYDARGLRYDRADDRRARDERRVRSAVALLGGSARTAHPNCRVAAAGRTREPHAAPLDVVVRLLNALLVEMPGCPGAGPVSHPAAPAPSAAPR